MHLLCVAAAMLPCVSDCSRWSCYFNLQDPKTRAGKNQDAIRFIRLAFILSVVRKTRYMKLKQQVRGTDINGDRRPSMLQASSHHADQDRALTNIHSVSCIRCCSYAALVILPCLSFFAILASLARSSTSHSSSSGAFVSLTFLSYAFFARRFSFLAF